VSHRGGRLLSNVTAHFDGFGDRTLPASMQTLLARVSAS
jgi:hypothetical protein